MHMIYSLYACFQQPITIVLIIMASVKATPVFNKKMCTQLFSSLANGMTSTDRQETEFSRTSEYGMDGQINE